MKIVVERNIAAPPKKLFDAISDVTRLPEVAPAISEVVILSKVQSGVGTRFRETRIMRGKPTTTDLEIVEYVPHQLLRIVNETHGVIWDSTFQIEAQGSGCKLTLCMEAKTKKFLQRLMMRPFKGMIQSGVKQHVDALQQYCEQP